MARPGLCRRISGRSQNLRKSGIREVGVVWSTWVSRDVELPVGLVVRWRVLGVRVRVCVPPDGAEQLAEVPPW